MQTCWFASFFYTFAATFGGFTLFILTEMKQRLYLFFKTYLLLLLLMVVQKPLFMAYHHELYADVSWMDWLRVAWHGLVIDRSLAAYFTVIPGVMLILSAWSSAKWLHQVWRGYHVLISMLIGLIFIVDMALYSYWGFRLDATPLFYFFSSPKDALASAETWMVAVFPLLYVAVAWGCYLLQYFFLCSERQLAKLRLPYQRLKVSGVLLLLTGLLFIPIRGGVTVSTMNTGKAYFSANNRLNHAAVNPAFSLMESLAKQNNFAKQYRFMKEEEANLLFRQLADTTQVGCHVVADSMAVSDSLQMLFRIERPDIYIVIMESFSSHLMKSLGGEAGVAVCLDRLADEGVLFTHFFANSFRTDRGLVSILSGYPAQPTTSLMKYPRKTQSLPSIARTLQEAGYATHYYYGGDADFTNMRSYLVSGGYETIVSDQNFPIGDRLSKWGVHDHLLFRRVIADLQQAMPAGQSGEGKAAEKQPQLTVIQTSSSHEPFEVPYERLNNPRLNAFAYADSCIGHFVDELRKLPSWENSVVLLVPDHLGCYPEPIDNFSVERYQIPLLLVGGAIKEPLRIAVYGSQQDIAATLLAQLGLDHSDFRFSKDLLHPAAPHFAFFTMPDGFGMVTPDNALIFDCQSDRLVLDEGTSPGRNLSLGKAYLQKLYDDIAQR